LEINFCPKSSDFWKFIAFTKLSWIGDQITKNFLKKLIATDTIRKLDGKRKIGAHRSPNLHVFNKEYYQKALKEGLVVTL